MVRKQAIWFTNLENQRKSHVFEFPTEYSMNQCEYFDNYDAINVNKVADILHDYLPCWFNCNNKNICPYANEKGLISDLATCKNKCNGIMGVPISFVTKFNPAMFEIIGTISHPKVNGREIYKRIFIRWKDRRQI